MSRANATTAYVLLNVMFGVYGTPVVIDFFFLLADGVRYGLQNRQWVGIGRMRASTYPKGRMTSAIAAD